MDWHSDSPRWDSFTEKAFPVFRLVLISGVIFAMLSMILTYYAVGYLNSIYGEAVFIEMTANQKNIMDILGMESWYILMLSISLFVIAGIIKLPFPKNNIIRHAYVCLAITTFIIFGFDFIHDLFVLVFHFL